MEHTHIIRASDLAGYASTRDSEAVIPELIYLLVRASCSELRDFRMPYGDAVNQPGWDGIVEADKGFFEFVPKGKSYWEIGTGMDPQSKATEDFRKRTAETDDVQRADSSFVFVTPRSSESGGWSEPKQTKWRESREDQGWKHIYVIDGVKLADWLREYPALGKWMATKLHWTRDLGGLSTAAEHWNNLVSECAPGDPPYPPRLFTVGRASACEALQDLFEGKTNALMLFAESPQDVADFVSAFLAGLDPDTSRAFSHRCLYIKDEEVWRSIVEIRPPHVLVAGPRLKLETEEGAELRAIALRQGHSVIVPLCGVWPGNSPEILKLQSPSQPEIESALKESGYSDIRAKELSRIGGDRISALRRHLHGTLPPYAIWGNATLIAQAGLVGKWDGSNPADRSALEDLLGKEYGEWIERLRPDTLRSDSPLIQDGEKWRLVARGEAWNCLGNRITDDDLERFRETAIGVLGECDPKFDLPKENRFAASIHSKVLAHSDLIRSGIAETLALMGSRLEALSSCSHGKAETTAILVVRELLNKASWERWASLDALMPLLAEAAPDEFLNAVESALIDLDNTPFHKIFAEEGETILGGWNYISGLLWALETLAWSPKHLSRVSVILADIASVDPGGNWANRPANSLVNIFVPWHVQTTASFKNRKFAIEAVLKEQPVVGWRLLLALLPHSQGHTLGSNRPIWREYIPRDWKGGVLQSECWEQIAAFAELLTNLAKADSEKLCELVKRLPDLPKPARDSLLKHLTTSEVVSLPEGDRLPLWENLDKLVRRHRKFPDSKWALPEDAVNKIAETAQALAPTSPEFKYRHLFSARDLDLFDGKGNYDEQQKHLNEARQAAIFEILDGGSLGAALEFATKVTAPYEVGRALGVIASDELEVEILPSLLDSEESASVRVVDGFISARFWKLKADWVDTVFEKNWTPEHRVKFLICLPFNGEIWRRVSLHLEETHEPLYWRSARASSYHSDPDLTIAVEKLLENGRESAAVTCIALTTDDKFQFDESLATRALIAVIENGRGFNELDNYLTTELIKRLQESETTDKDALFRIEWNFLSWLDEFSTGSPVTLEKRLAFDPAFFAEVIGLVFRPKNTSKDDNEKPDAQKQNFAINAYKLLAEWKRCPGTQNDGSFNLEAFNTWINDAHRITEKSGHAEVAQIQIGRVLIYAPPDPDGLWIHNAVAEMLNSRDTGDMRSGFTTGLFNQRGAYWSTHGQEERKLASDGRAKADALNSKGYTRFATAMHEFAKGYDRQAEYESKRDPFED